MPLTLLTTTTYPSPYLALSVSEFTLSLSPLPTLLFYTGFCQGPTPVPCNIHYSLERGLRSGCSFGSARFPLWFMYVFTTARYKSYDLCTDWGTLITALRILGICARPRGRGHHLTFLSRTNPTDQPLRNKFCLAYSGMINTTVHITFSTRNKVLF